MRAIARRRNGLTQEVRTTGHTIIADEPAHLGGSDLGPAPVDLLAASLASCAAVTMELYARRKGWRLGDIEVEVTGDVGATDGSTIEVVLRFPAELSEARIQRLVAIAKRCPVHKTLAGEIRLRHRVEEPQSGQPPMARTG